MDFSSGNFPNVQYHWAGCCGLDGLDVGRALRLEQTWEIASLEISQLGGCNLGKYHWKVAAWEKAFGKVPNIIKLNL